MPAAASQSGKPASNLAQKESIMQKNQKPVEESYMHILLSHHQSTALFSQPLWPSVLVCKMEKNIAKESESHRSWAHSVNSERRSSASGLQHFYVCSTSPMASATYTGNICFSSMHRSYFCLKYLWKNTSFSCMTDKPQLKQRRFQCKYKALYKSQTLWHDISCECETAYRCVLLQQQQFKDQIPFSTKFSILISENEISNEIQRMFAK